MNSQETPEYRAHTLAQLLEREVANLPRRKDVDWFEPNQIIRNCFFKVGIISAQSLANREKSLFDAI
jgi:hypothetical protein